MLRALKSFFVNQAAVAAIEFSLLVPVFAFALFGEFEVYRYVMMAQRVQIAAESAAQIFADTSKDTSGRASTPGDGVLDGWDLNFVLGSPIYLYPDVFEDPRANNGGNWTYVINVQAAGIRMIQQSDGSYLPKTDWHSNVDFTGNTPHRACDTVYNIVADSAPPSYTSLPADVVGPNGIIVIDIQASFQFYFLGGILPQIPINRSVYMAPRNVPFVEFVDVWMATTCPKTT